MSLEKKKILVGTRNEAKFQVLKECMKNIEEIELIDLNTLPSVDDSSLIEGDDYLENAKLKAKFYFEKTGIPSIATDNILWIEKWPKNKGFIVHIRKEANPESPRATDQEVIDYMKKFLQSVGGESNANFFYGIAYADESGVSSWSVKNRDKIIQTKQTENFRAGFPMESLLIDKVTGESNSIQKNEIAYEKLIKCLETEVKEIILK